MLNTVLASVLIASVAAHRIHISDRARSQSKFGASCEDLHATFHNRVAALQTLIDANPDHENTSRTTQVRVVMRSFQAVRTLRRARTCAWVVDGDDEEIEQMRAIVRAMLAGNPCTEAARAEFQAGVNAETEEVGLQSLHRAMSIMTSDDCEVQPTHDESVALTGDEDADLVEVEAQAEDSIDELLDAVETESSDSAGGAFVQADGAARLPSFRRIMRNLGVALLFILLLLACTGAAAVIGALIGMALATLLATPCRAGACAGGGFAALFALTAGGSIAGAVGFLSCSYQLYTQLLPAVAPAAQAIQ